MICRRLGLVKAEVGRREGVGVGDWVWCEREAVGLGRGVEKRNDVLRWFQACFAAIKSLQGVMDIAWRGHGIYFTS